MFQTLLIAKNGRIGRRIERTATRLGVTLANYDGNNGATAVPFVVDVPEIIATAKRTGAEAIHPGDVLPLTRIALAKATKEAGLLFLGPSESALTVLADKVALRRLVDGVDVRVVPGSIEAVASGAEARAFANDFEDGIVIKPVAGARGVGITIVRDADEAERAWTSAVKTATEVLGDGRVYIERKIPRARHIEVLVFRDAAGGELVLDERECSIQRRLRPILSESPAPAITGMPDGEAVRQALADQAVRIAKALDLVGVITVEFLLDTEGLAWFVDANADDSGASDATHMLTGIDSFEVAFSLALGGTVPDESKLFRAGHAFEVAICAEDPKNGFQLSTGGVEVFQLPKPVAKEVRVLATADVGTQITAKGSALVARLTTFGTGRQRALLAMDRALAGTHIGPVLTTQPLLRSVLNHESFRAGLYDDAFVERFTR